MKHIFITFIMLFAVLNSNAQYEKYYTDMPVNVKKTELPKIPKLSVNVRDYGAVGDGLTLCSETIQRAIDDVAKRGGGHVNIPAGVWLVTNIELRSNVDLHLDMNALIQQTPDKSKYKMQPDGKRLYPCIHGENLHDVSITGRGTVDGMGQYWRPVKRGKMSDYEWDTYVAMGGQIEDNGKLWMPYNLRHVNNVTKSSANEESLRSDLFRPTHCDRVLVQGVSFQNSPRFTVHPCQCTNVTIDGVTARSPWNVQNADGIDLSNCRQCLVVNCYVDCGDDGLCLKSGSGESGVKDGPCQDILIQDCKVAHAHGGFVMGSDVAGGMDRIVVRNCMFSNTDIGLRFKSALGRGGKTKDVFINNIVMTDIANEAILFNCGYFDNRYSAAVSEKKDDKDRQQTQYAPDFQDIHIDGVVCREAKTAVKARGIEGLDCVHDITISNSSFFYREVPTDIETKTSNVKLENVKLATFDVNNGTSALTDAVKNGRYVDTKDNGYLQLDKPIAIKGFRVDSDKSVGPDGTIYYTCITIKSKSDPNLSLEYGFYMNNHHKGRLMVNGVAEDNVGSALHDGYIYYDLSRYGNDLYIWGLQNNFPTTYFLYI